MCLNISWIFLFNSHAFSSAQLLLKLKLLLGHHPLKHCCQTDHLLSFINADLYEREWKNQQNMKDVDLIFSLFHFPASPLSLHTGQIHNFRLTITASCPMFLQYFPMDRQLCYIEIESCKYNGIAQYMSVWYCRSCIWNEGITNFKRANIFRTQKTIEFLCSKKIIPKRYLYIYKLTKL